MNLIISERPTKTPPLNMVVYKISQENNWKFIHSKINVGVTIAVTDIEQYYKDGVFLEVYYTGLARIGKFKVVSIMDHENNGFQIMERNNVTLPELRQLFRNPRTHTGKGKADSQKRSGLTITDVGRLFSVFRKQKLNVT